MLKNYFKFLSSKELFVFGLILSILPFYIISFHNQPSAFDDFQMAVLAKEKGNWGLVKYTYYNWTGRYTATFLQAYFSPLLNKSWHVGFQLSPVVFFTIFVLSIYYFIKAVYVQVKALQALGAGLCISSLYLYAMPNVSDVFYWFQGATVYITGIILFLLSIIFLLKTIKATSFYKVFFCILLILFLVAAIGANESILLAILFLSFISLIASYIIRSKTKTFLIAFFLIASIAAFASISAPGNVVRTSILYGEGNSISLSAFINAVTKSLYFTTVNAVGWMNNFALIIASLLFTPAALALVNQNWWLKKVTSVHPFLSLLITIIFLSVQAFPSYLGAGDVDPRVWSSIYFFFLLSWFFNWLVLVNFFKARVEQFDYSKLAPLKAVLVLILLFSAQGNINQAYLDLFTRAPQYSSHLKERYELIQASKGKDLVVPPIFERLYKYPKTIYVMDITTNPDDGRNRRMSEYFGLKSIRLSKDPVR